MRALFASISLAALQIPAFVAAEESPDVHPGRLLVLAVALDQDAEAPTDATIDLFNFAARDMERVFRDRSSKLFSEVHSTIVLGKQVTHARILKELDTLRRTARDDDLVVLYWGSHGETWKKTGWAAGTADGQWLSGKELKEHLGKVASQVVLIVDTCGSAGVAHSHARDVPPPSNVTVVCACRERQSTTTALTVSLLEALYGKGDFNRDGYVQTSELLQYIQRRYREWYPGSDQDPKVLRPVIVEAEDVPLDLKLTQASNHVVCVYATDSNDESFWLGGLLVKQEPDRFHIRYFGYDNDRPGAWSIKYRVVGRDRICFPADPPPVKVKWKGEWYNARVLSQQGDKFRIHYMGYGPEWDETVTRDRVRYLFCTEPVMP